MRSKRGFKGKKHSKATKALMSKKRNEYLKQKEESLHPHRLTFPAKKKSETLGQYKIKKFLYFCEKYLRHVHGVFAGRPVILMKWQKEIIQKVFGTVKKDGTRQYRRLILHVGRKNGKSFLAACIILYFLSEESFYDPAMEITTAALSKIQSQSTIFKTVRMLVEHSEELTQLIRIRRVPPSLKNIVNDAIYEPISSDGKLQLGRNVSLAILDEGHGLPSGELYDSLVFSQSLRREPLLVSVSTAGTSKGGFYYNQIYSRAKEIIKDPSIDPETAAFVYEVPINTDWRDPKNFILANPALDVAEGGFRPSEELRRALRDAKETESQIGFRTFYLNQFISYGARGFVPLEYWDRCAKEINLAGMEDRRVVAGLDFSANTDLTALSLIIEGGEDSKTWTIFVFHWLAGLDLSECEKRDKIHYQKFIETGHLFFDGKEVIDVQSILDVLSRLKKYFPKLEIIGYDPYLTSEIQQLGRFFKLVPVPQQVPYISPSMKVLKAKVINREIEHDGDLLLRSQFENVRVTEDHAGNIRPDKSKSFSRIDGLVSLIIAGVMAIQENFRR